MVSVLTSRSPVSGSNLGMEAPHRAILGATNTNKVFKKSNKKIVAGCFVAIYSTVSSANSVLTLTALNLSFFSHVAKP